MNAAEDYMLLLLHAHIIAAAQVVQDLIPVLDLAKAVVVNYVRLPRMDDNNTENCDDKVYVYAELLTLVTLWHGFPDAIRGGDGETILRY